MKDISVLLARNIRIISEKETYGGKYYQPPDTLIADFHKGKSGNGYMML